MTSARSGLLSTRPRGLVDSAASEQVDGPFLSEDEVVVFHFETLLAYRSTGGRKNEEKNIGEGKARRRDMPFCRPQPPLLSALFPQQRVCVLQHTRLADSSGK